jgi:hypothetical protein
MYGDDLNLLRVNVNTLNEITIQISTGIGLKENAERQPSMSLHLVTRIQDDMSTAK